MPPRICRVPLLVVVWAFASSAVLAQGSSGLIEPHGAALAPNTNADYKAMRAALPTGDGVLVKDLTIERQGGTFHFTNGSFFFYGQTGSKMTGAVYIGTGTFGLAPKAVSEQHSLALLTKSGVMQQDFTSAVFRFTDGTDKEIRKASVGSAGATAKQADQMAQEMAISFQHKLHQNFELRLLEDALSQAAGGFFLASFRAGGAFTGHNVLFVVDPEGTPFAAPDQVELDTWDDDGWDTWAAYRMTGDAANAAAVVPVHVSAEKLDVGFDKSGTIRGSAETTLTTRKDGVQVVPLKLYRTLRVSGVYSETGDPLDFVQEDKDHDPEFAVILPKAVKSGETVRLLTTYAGKDALLREGDGVYYLTPGARESWYPAGHEELGGFADFHMTFHLPKGLQIVATGKQVSLDADDGGGKRAVWVTDVPIPVAGFNLGDFKESEAKTPQGFDVRAYANVSLPDRWLGLMQSAELPIEKTSANGDTGLAMGTMSTTGATKVEVSEGSAAIQVYSDYFGKLPYDHVALTEQSACNYGQSWPMLVYLPICAFWDSTIHNRLGLMSFGQASYWNDVTAHEVAHQWWGNVVGFGSYRDQWMSEGFADFSVSLFLAATSKNMSAFHQFWKEQRDNLFTKSQAGMRPIDVGPLTMGPRVANDKTGNIYQSLIYSKGAYVLHMLQVLYWSPQEGEKPFKNSMQQFVQEFKGKAATTEDFKASLEQSMPKGMDFTKDGKLDWFFNEWVYGTEVPHYDISSEFTVVDGETSVHFKVTQSKVSPDFLMPVPLYVQMEDGKTVRLLNLGMKGDVTSEHTIKLGKMPSPAKKMLLNYNDDVLSD